MYENIAILFIIVIAAVIVQAVAVCRSKNKY